MSEQDKLPSPFENWEAMEQATEDLSRIIWKYYKDLLNRGFAKNQAFHLTVKYQKALFELGRPLT